MVGGDPEVFEKVKPILSSMGSSVVWTGPVGAGNVTKLANQIIVACNIAAMGEALALATKAGVDPELVFEAIRGGLAGSTVLDAKAPMVLRRDFRPDSALSSITKTCETPCRQANRWACPSV
jgi:2-hydroxy-3-oxopropionate reductase